MKKRFVLFAAVLVAALMLFNLVACTPKDGKNTENSDTNSTGESTAGNLEGSLEEIIEKIYKTADLEDSFKEFIENGTFYDAVTAEKTEYYLGKSDIEFEEALASEPMIQPGAYSLVLVRVKEGANVEKIENEIRENVNPTKWVCVGVKKENVIVDSIDNIIILIMSDIAAQPLHEAFLALGNK
ncbi:MAG: hypothetical protein GX303_08570 [Clostridiales bacterium]|nr:hypothetical protein [Clostridiales bacterium]